MKKNDYLLKLHANIQDAVDNYEFLYVSSSEENEAKQYILGPNFTQELLKESIGKKLYDLNNIMNNLTGEGEWENE